MTRALLVAHHYPPHIGGLGVVVWQQAQSMAESGYDVVVLTSQYAKRQPEQPSSRIEVIRIGCWHVFETQFSIVFPLFSPRLVSELWKQVRRAAVVHIHDVFYMSSWLAAVIAIIAHKPLILTQHVAMVEHSSRLVMTVQRLVYASIGRWIFSRARRIVVYNKNVHAFLRSRDVPEARIAFMVNGIDTAKFSPLSGQQRIDVRTRYGLPQGRRLVLFVGRLVEKKGIHILLEARDPEYDIIFVGPGTMPTHETSLGVRWLGPLDHTQIQELYGACDLFAFPAVGEIFTLVMQEAMACGLPVVTTDDPAYMNSIVSEAVVLCGRDAPSLRAAIKDLLADPDRMLALGVRSRQLAIEHFDWRANSSGLIDVYATTLCREAQ